MNGSSQSTLKTLFLAPPQLHVEADHAVLVASAYDRKIPVDVVLALDDLLRALRYVGAVGQREVVGELLLDGHLRTPSCRVRLGGQRLRVNLDSADSEQLLQTIADSGVQRLINNEVRRLVIEQCLTGLLLQLFRLFTSPPQSQQGDDVGLRKGRLRTVVDVEPIRRPRNGQIEIVIANMCRSLQVDLRLDGDRICERNVAALQAELDPVERGVPF